MPVILPQSSLRVIVPPDGRAAKVCQDTGRPVRAREVPQKIFRANGMTYRLYAGNRSGTFLSVLPVIASAWAFFVGSMILFCLEKQQCHIS